MSREEFVAELRRRLEEHEARPRAAHAAAGRKYVGAERVRRVSWREAPATRAPRRVRDPHVAAPDASARGRAIEPLRRFRAAYREALRCWSDGQRDVRCHDPPAAAPSPASG